MERWNLNSVLIMNLLYHFTHELCTESDIQEHFLEKMKVAFKRLFFEGSAKFEVDLV